MERERIRIPNDVTYSPVSLTDVALAAPLVSRLLLGATLPGRALQMAALGVYAASSLQDWMARQGVRRIDFLREFGADVKHLEEMPREAREAEIRTLVTRLNDSYTPERVPRRELAAVADRHLTDYIAGVTGQHVETSSEVRSTSLVQFIFPFALGACDFLSGDIAIFRDTGVFEPHVIAHEFCHRKGYWKELEAQALAYLALVSSGEPVLVQSALAERLHRDLRVLADDDTAEFHRLVTEAGLRPDLEKQFIGVRPELRGAARPMAIAMRTLYEERMRWTGQNGLSDYDLGFTNFLYTFETSTSAQQRPPVAGALHGGVGAGLRAALTPA